MAAPYQITSGDIISYTVWQKLFGQTILNRMHYVYNGPSMQDGPAELQQFLTIVTGAQFWSTVMRSRQSKDVLHEKASAQKIFTKRWAAVWYPMNTQGANNGASLPSNVAIVIQKQVAQADRKGLQGRLHVAGVPMDNVLGDDLTGAAFGQWSQVAAAMGNTVITGTGKEYKPVVLSKAMGQVHSNDLFGSAVNVGMRVMRRRTLGVGI